MALNPRYVNILQNDWMKDDFTTLTNAYPDHEDIQGPTGLDVAKTIAQFIPFQGHVITTEQHMTPILRQGAWERNSLLKEQSVLDWRLLGRDVLSMLPYNEHPKILHLCLGLQMNWAFREIKPFGPFVEYVIPDIGVLKSYGPIHINGRSVSFTNGMSANERADFYPTGPGPPFQRHQTQRTQSFKWSCTTTEQIGSLGKAFCLHCRYGYPGKLNGHHRQQCGTILR